MVVWHLWLKEHESDQTGEIVKDREICHAAVHGVPKGWTWLSDWTTRKKFHILDINSSHTVAGLFKMKRNIQGSLDNRNELQLLCLKRPDFRKLNLWQYAEMPNSFLSGLCFPKLSNCLHSHEFVLSLFQVYLH